MNRIVDVVINVVECKLDFGLLDVTSSGLSPLNLNGFRPDAVIIPYSIETDCAYIQFTKY